MKKRFILVILVMVILFTVNIFANDDDKSILRTPYNSVITIGENDEPPVVPVQQNPSNN